MEGKGKTQCFRGYLKPWSTSEVAEYLGVATCTVHRLASLGIIPSKKSGGRLYFDPRKIVEYAGMS